MTKKTTGISLNKAEYNKTSYEQVVDRWPLGQNKPEYTRISQKHATNHSAVLRVHIAHTPATIEATAPNKRIGQNKSELDRISQGVIPTIAARVAARPE